MIRRQTADTELLAVSQRNHYKVTGDIELNACSVQAIQHFYPLTLSFNNVHTIATLSVDQRVQ